jgi:hypothetical protein
MVRDIYDTNSTSSKISNFFVFTSLVLKNYSSPKNVRPILLVTNMPQPDAICK